MNDVAKSAGVSRGTVSNYVNGKKVNLVTQQKIENAIRKLNYIPNAAARSLRTKKSDFVVFIVPNVNSPFFSELSYHMQQELAQNHYKMILCNSNNSPEQEIEYIQMANMQKVSGLITMSYAEVSNLVQTNAPIVSIEKQVSENVPLITSDNYQGGRLAAENLIKRGAKNLLFIAKYPVINVSAVRERGFVDYCNEKNINVSRFLVKKDESLMSSFDNFISSNIHKENFTYDGIFSDTDENASDFCRMLVKNGIQVPQQVQIIGFDGAKIYPNQHVFISSIRQPTELIAKISVQRLVHSINSDTQEEHTNNKIVLPVSFVNGMTTR